MTATMHITAEITDFARRVREQLSDLPAEEVDDLTDGLEADMTEAFSENPGHALPEPADYAAELRTAAGLPVRERRKGSIRQSFGGVAESIRMKREGVAANLRKSPTMAKFLDAMVELRPAWWLLRAWVAFQVVAAFFGREGTVLPYDVLGWVLLVAFAAISVQWGRKQWLPFAWLAGLIVVGNIAAVALLVPALSGAHASSLPYEHVEGNYYPEAEALKGVTLDGKEVTNIFAYGSDGKPLDGVQLFDQEGNPLSTSVPGGNGCLDPQCTETGVWVPSTLETGAKAWNVFPMQMALALVDEYSGELAPDPAATPKDRTPPFIKVPAVQAPEPEKKVEKDNN